MPLVIHRIAVGLGVALLMGSWCNARAFAQETRYHYRVLIGLKSNKGLNEALGKIQTPANAQGKVENLSWDNLRFDGGLGRQVCAAFNTHGHSFQRREAGIGDSDEIIMLAARWKDGGTVDADCALIPLREAGIQQGTDISFYSRGFEGGEEVPVEIRNQGLQVDAKAAIDGRFTLLRLPFSRLLLYRDANGNLVRAQNHQVIRLAVTRSVQKDEVAQATQPFQLYWEYRISRPRVWTGIELPTLWSYTPKDETSRALPVALATGVRFGTRHEFPRYIDWLIFGAPGFKVSGDTTSAVTSFALGTMLNFADFVGFGIGLDKNSDKPTRLSFSVSIGSNIRSAFPK